jgi:branched-chain amino acid transport system substrate-binding protein
MQSFWLLSVFCLLANAAEVLVPCASGDQCLYFGFTYQTGSQGTEGAALKRGYQMWANKTNAAGGIVTKGGSFKVSLLAYDDKSNATLTAQGYSDLIKVDGVNYTLGPFGSSFTVAAVNTTQKYDKLLLFSQAADDSIFSNPNNPVDTFGIMSQASDYMHQLVILFNASNYKSIVVLRSTSGFTTSVWNGMLGLLKDYPNLVILANVTYPPSNNSNPPSDAKFRPLVASLQKAVPKPDVFISLSFLSEGPYVTSALRYNDYQPRAIAITSLNYTDGNSKYAMGPEQWNVHQNINDDFYGTTTKFNSDYFAMYPNTGEPAVTLYTAGAAASGYVLASAIASAASLDQADVRQALLTLNGTGPDGSFPTIYGPVKFNAIGQNIKKEMVVTQCVINNNKLQGVLVAPPDQAAQAVLPIAYGCNNSKACNFVLESIQNGTKCTFPPAGSDVCPPNTASSIRSSFTVVLLILSVFLFTYE